MPDDDPRRQKPVTLSWRSGEVCRLYIDDELWGAVEWSEKRQAWCIEDAQGRCLSHKSHVHGSAVAKNEAVALAQAMIADGRMPTPEQAKQTRKARLEARRDRPAEITRRQQRQEADRLLQVLMDADFCEREAAPMWEVLDQALDLTDPELWKSNSFAVVRPRLVIALQAYIAKVEYEAAAHEAGRGRWRRPVDEPRLARAKQLLAVLGVARCNGPTVEPPVATMTSGASETN